MVDFNSADDASNEREPLSEEAGEQYAAGAAPEFTESSPFIDDLTTDDLEEAYLRALEAMESADWAVDGKTPDDTDFAADAFESEGESAPAAAEFESSPLAETNVDVAAADFLGSAPTSPMDAADPSGNTGAGAGTLLSASTAPSTLPSTLPSNPSEEQANERTVRARPSRIIEACLFVGGQPLPAKKLANLLDGNNDPSDIEHLIDELNLEYAAQARPYEIRLGDGGYRLTLRSEFDPVRGRVYGVGPRDVKLSQDVLEILALVAYQQPITQAAVEACKPNSANVLRQLLRRELISLTRVDQSRNGVEYRTTPRFLQLFGLGQLSELPRPEDLSIR